MQKAHEDNFWKIWLSFHKFSLKIDVLLCYLFPILICFFHPPKNGVIALCPNTLVVKCKYYVPPKQNGFNDKIHWYSIVLTFIFKFTARLLWTKICVFSNLSNCRFTTWQYSKSGIDPLVDGQSAIIPSLGGLKLTKFPPPYGGGLTFYYASHDMNRFIPHVHRARPLNGSKTVRIWLKIE